MTALVAGGLLALFVLGEGRLRRGEEARSTEAGPQDRGSTRRVGVAFGVSIVAFVIASLLLPVEVAVLPELVGLAGVAVMIGGIALRVWAALVLGSSYTRTLRVSGAQQLVRSGPYAVLRHPGYAGAIVMWIGASFATRDALGVFVIVPVILWAYGLRIAAEERMLAAAFGEAFRDYERTTRRLIPFVY